MKLFETVLETFRKKGMEWDESAKMYLIAKKHHVLQLVTVLSVISNITFLMYEAKTFYQYTMGFFIFSATIMCATVSAIITLRVIEFNDFIAKWNSVMDESM